METTNDNDVSKSSQQNSNFYVRVKRNRDDPSIEQICIVEDISSTPLKKQRSLDILVSQLSGLSSSSTMNNSDKINQPKKLVLKRIRTLNDIDQYHNIQNVINHIDSDVNTHKQVHEDISHHSTTSIHKDMKLMVTSSMKTIISNSNDSEQSIAIIDMQQIKKNSIIDNMISTKIVDNRSICPANSSSTTTIPSSACTRILDPATRLLEKGIASAIKTGDFNHLSAALIQGADANYQTSKENGGYTALMVACMKGNIRMVKRLLQKGVDVLRISASGHNAYELLLKPTTATTLAGRNQVPELEEIHQLLFNATRKAEDINNQVLLTNKASDHYQRRRRFLGSSTTDIIDTKRLTTTTASDNDNEQLEQANYVYDIYHYSSMNIPSTVYASEKGEEDLSEENLLGVSPDVNNDHHPHNRLIPEVKVEGLKILNDGNIDIECLITCYDSDWSDLGDDEDPDSNDERYHGNDYPEEEEDLEGDIHNDDEEEEEDEDIDNIHLHPSRGNKYHIGDDDDDEIDDDADGDNSDYDVNEEDDYRDDERMSGRYINKKTSVPSPPTYSSSQSIPPYNNSNNNTIQHNFNKQSTSTATFERRYGVGKVMRPQVRFENVNGNNEEEYLGNNSIYQPHSTESLQKLWGEETNYSQISQRQQCPTNEGISSQRQQCPTNEGISSPYGEKTQRIEQMNQRTGMVFAGDPKEFDRISGLPKYADELSDDDIDVHVHYLQETSLVNHSIIYDNNNNNNNNNNDNSNNRKKMIFTTEKPSLDTIAYDSELDHDNDD